MAEQMDIEREDEGLGNFYTERCGCKQDCLSLFPEGMIEAQRLAVQELTKEEKDLILIGQIRAQQYVIKH